MACFLVPMLDAAPRVGDLIRAHARIANHDQLVVMAVLVDEVHRRDTLGVAAAIVLPHGLVEKIVKIEVFELLDVEDEDVGNCLLLNLIQFSIGII